jgi:hypothetical protein
MGILNLFHRQKKDKEEEMTTIDLVNEVAEFAEISDLMNDDQLKQEQN